MFHASTPLDDPPFQLHTFGRHPLLKHTTYGPPLALARLPGDFTVWLRDQLGYPFRQLPVSQVAFRLMDKFGRPTVPNIADHYAKAGYASNRDGTSTPAALPLPPNPRRCQLWHFTPGPW